MTNICTLDDGRRIKFSVLRRNRDPFYLVRFRGPDGKPKERSTSEPGQRRAIDSACRIIRDAYDPDIGVEAIDWQEAEEILIEHMRAKNLRQATITDYVSTIHTLRDAFPQRSGPNQISALLAERYKMRRLRDGYSPWTVKGNLNTLRIVYGKWWIKIAKILIENPFEAVEPPKVDRKPPRIILPEEIQAFVGWLSTRWDDWRLPLLFLEVKGLVGCRITELASARTDGLSDGRIRFTADTTKGRKQRSVRLPQAIFDELREVAGRRHVFSGFSEQLRAVHIQQGNSHHAACVREFVPAQLVRWLQKEKQKYLAATPEAKPFRLHNFRGTAMSKARTAGVSFDDAAVAFGCHPETMRKHYISLNEETITDRVMDAIQGGNGESQPQKRVEKSVEMNGDGSSDGNGQPKLE